jgi:hypothetical protein
MNAPRPTVVGFSGHQGLSATTEDLVRVALKTELSRFVPMIGVTSLAAGSDQIFAECVLELDGMLSVVVPSMHYEDSFTSPEDLEHYDRLLHVAAHVTVLNHERPGEAAYWDAGKQVVDQADVVLAVWDGEPAAGLGGTGDVVRYATERDRDVVVIWPTGAHRTPG